MDFSTYMLLALLITGAIWLIDSVASARRRQPGAKLPLLVDYSKSFFPVILAVFLLRSFVVEPFKIPSGSMMPTLIPGDFILVNKFIYGLRVPVLNSRFIDISTPHRGDVVVFHYPDDPSIDYIKRVVGVPGDVVQYKDKVLTINGHVVPEAKAGDYSYMRPGLNYVTAVRYHEQLGKVAHDTLIEPDEPTVRLEDVSDFPGKQNCSYDDHGFTCKVPANSYFALGDNRDDSRDSRYWGFVPDRNLVGKAFLIWWNFNDFKRIGQHIR